MHRVKCSRRIMISANAIFPPVMLRAERYHPHVASGIWHMVNLNRVATAHEARHLRNLAHVRQPVNAVL